MDNNDEGVLLALVAALVGFGIIEAYYSGGFSYPKDEGWVYSYQNVIAGGLALLGAYIGARAVQRQIRGTLEIERRRRARRLAAIRAVGPLTLSAIVAYGRTCADQLTQLHAACVDHSLPAGVKMEGAVPAPPPESIELLREFIEYSEEPEPKLIEELLRRLQIQQSRMQRLAADVENPAAIVFNSIWTTT
jgi:hypothetical protein